MPERRCSSSCCFVASVLVLHGLFGPQVAPANLATVLSWVQYRGWLIIALLAAGNFFCTGCPFVLVRDAGRRLWTPSRRWPRWLRVKWIGIALFVAVLFIVRALRSVGVASRHGLARARLFRRRTRNRSSVHRRDLLQVPLPDRAVQFRRLDDVAARTAGAAARDVPDVPDRGLHQGPAR